MEGKGSVKMSVFSECLNLIRINKNLYAADIARLIDMDASTISKMA